eukprot:scaffold15134_cov71-Skeletonema_marinoi.AAC.1
MLPLDGLDWSTSMATISLSVTLLVISASKTYLQQVKARAEESANRIKEKITLLDEDENTVQTYEGGLRVVSNCDAAAASFGLRGFGWVGWMECEWVGA